MKNFENELKLGGGYLKFYFLLIMGSKVKVCAMLIKVLSQGAIRPD